MKVELRTAKVLTAEKVPNSRKLVKLSIDVGTEQRTLVAGIADAYEPEALVGRTVVMVFNLKPAKLMGIESNGMVLAASPDGGKPTLVGFDQEIPPGACPVNGSESRDDSSRVRASSSTSAVIDSHCHLAGASSRPISRMSSARAQRAGVTGALCILSAGDADEDRAARALRDAVAGGAICHRHPSAQAGAVRRPRRARRVDASSGASTRASRRAPSARSGSTITTTSRRATCSRRSSARRSSWRMRAGAAGRHPHPRGDRRHASAFCARQGAGSCAASFTASRGDAGDGAGRAAIWASTCRFAGIVTFPKAEALREAARMAPPDRLLVETDAPVSRAGPASRQAQRTGVRRPSRRAAGRGPGVHVGADWPPTTTANFATLFGLPASYLRRSNGLAR